MSVRVVDFKTDYNNSKSVDMVLLAPAGAAFDKCQTWQRIKDIMPPEDWDETKKSSQTFMDMTEKWKVVGPAYRAWKEGSEVPETGTPLAAWSGVSAEQAAVLRQMAIRTVEDVRDMSESAFTRLPFPNARQLPKLAGEFLSGQDVAAKDARILAMEEQMAAMEEMLAEATGEKRKPGRPKKTEAA